MGEPDEIFILQKIHMTELERLCLISISVPSFLKELQFLSKYFAKKNLKNQDQKNFISGLTKFWPLLPNQFLEARPDTVPPSFEALLLFPIFLSKLRVLSRL